VSQSPPPHLRYPSLAGAARPPENRGRPGFPGTARELRVRLSDHVLRSNLTLDTTTNSTFSQIQHMEQITSPLAVRTATKPTVSGSGSDATGSVTKRFLLWNLLLGPQLNLVLD
jgi:hypothetical protein